MPASSVRPGVVAARRASRRQRQTRAYKDVEPLQGFLDALRKAGIEIDQLVLSRTSTRSKPGHAPMFDLTMAMLPQDPDVAALQQVGAKIVTDEGAADRARLEAFELRRGSVPGGHGYGLLGYLIVIGKTLFVLYLETARKADIPGQTVDQTRNAFTDALCQILRALRPSVVYTPLVSRVFRNLDFAQQAMRTMRDLRVRLVAEGSEVPLGGDQEIFGLLKAWFAAQEATSLVGRLDSIEKGIYLDGGWYGAEFLLPWTWRCRSTVELDPITGETRRTVIDKHQLEDVSNSGSLLLEFVVEGGKRDVTDEQLGRLLGQGGARSRSAADQPNPPTLDKLQQPGPAARTLMQPQWIDAWRFGYYRRSIRLKEDLRDRMPAIRDRISTVERPDGSVELYLDVTVPMPAPDGGWPPSDAQWQLFLDVRFEQTPQRRGRAAHTGAKRPLAGLCQYEDEPAGLVWRLTCTESGPTYQLRSRPRAEAFAFDDDGHPVAALGGWNKAPVQVSLPSADLHASLAAAITAALKDLGSKVRPVVLQRTTAVDPLTDLRTKLVDATALVTRRTNRLKGIREERQEVRGDPELTKDDKRAKLAELDEDEKDARADLATARAAHAAAVAALAAAEAEHANEVPTADEAGTATANLADLRVVAAALARTTYTAPDVLNRVLHRCIRDLRVRPVWDGTAVSWSCRLLVPLVDQADAEITLESASPVPAFTTAGATPDEAASSGLRADVVAGWYFRDGLTFPQMAQRRNWRGQPLDGSGHGSSYLYKKLNTWLASRGVPIALRAAAIDMPLLPGTDPARLRRDLWHALSPQPPTDDWLLWLRSVYTGQPAGRHGVTWCGEMHGDHTALRRAHAVLVQSRAHEMPSHELAAVAAVPYARLLELTGPLTSPGARSTTRGAPLDKDFGAGGRGSVRLRHCPHDDCLELHRTGRPGVLILLHTPETSASSLLDVEERDLGLVCTGCRRLPGRPDLVLPEHYLFDWVGGRRLEITLDGATQHIGTRLAQAADEIREPAA